MKVLVMSDTHRDLVNARIAIQHTMKESLDAVIHCGDHITDAERLQQEFSNVHFYFVPGNCDGYCFGYDERIQLIELEDTKIFVTHGHMHSIKYDYDELMIDVRAHGAHIGLCGHSHVTHIQKEQGITIVNPGSITLPRDLSYPSYAVLEICKGKPVHIAMMMIKNMKPSIHPLW